MTGLEIALGVVGGLVFSWLSLLFVMWRLRPRQGVAAEALRAIPDVVRLIPRLARDSSLPRSLRLWLWALVAYLASPIDLVPDFIPIVGYADDAVIVGVALRAVVRRAGHDALARHWPGTDTGLSAVEHLAGLA